MAFGCEFLHRLAGAECDTLRAEVQGVRGVGRVHVTVVLVDDLPVLKTSRAHGAEQLCIQQSAGNSARPERDVVQCAVGYLPFHKDVAHLQASARLEDAEPLAQGLGLVEGQVEDAVADDHVREGIGDGK